MQPGGTQKSPRFFTPEPEAGGRGLDGAPTLPNRTPPRPAAAPSHVPRAAHERRRERVRDSQPSPGCGSIRAPCPALSDRP
jgi:hypothetical protein